MHSERDGYFFASVFVSRRLRSARFSASSPGELVSDWKDFKANGKLKCERFLDVSDVPAA